MPTTLGVTGRGLIDTTGDAAPRRLIEAFPAATRGDAKIAAAYVAEIVETVRAGLRGINSYPSHTFETFGRFLFDNPDQLELVRQRTISFWNEHHRSLIPRESYPGFALLDSFDRAVTHQANKPGNRQRAAR